VSENLRAILFDYGNTLIEFSRPQVEICDRALASALEARFGAVDYEALKAIRDRDRARPYQPPEYRENDLPTITRNLIQGLFEMDPTPELLDEVRDVRHRVFVDVIEAPEYLADLLSRLKRRFLLGVVSNYPDGDSIRESLDRVGVRNHFDTIVVSGDHGRAKPHPEPFQRALVALNVEPEESLFVGDNWVADIQGAKRLGLGAVLTTQWMPPEDIPRKPGDAEPDAVIGHLSEILQLVNGKPDPTA